MEEQFRLIDGAYSTQKAHYLIDHVLNSCLNKEAQQRAHKVVAAAQNYEAARDRAIIEAPVYIRFDNTQADEASSAKSEYRAEKMRVQCRMQFNNVTDVRNMVLGLIRAKIDYLEKQVIPPETDGDNQVVACAERRIRNLQKISDNMRTLFQSHANAHNIEIYIPISIAVANHQGYRTDVASKGSRAMT